jgi:hypothetical protein
MPAQVLVDPALDKIAQARCDAGCRDVLKKMADEVIKTSIATEFIAAMEMAGKREWLKDGLLVTLVRVNQAMLVFYADISAVASRIEAAVPAPKNTVPVPPKVLGKMAAIRIKRILKAYSQKNEQIEMNNERVEKALAEAAGKPLTGWMANWKIEARLTPPENVVTVQGLRDAVAKGKTELYKHDAERIESDVSELVSKPELGDEHVADGWHMVLAGLVMSE